MSSSGPNCRDCALRLLTRREHSRLELHSKLIARGFASAQIDGLLDQLQTEGLQSDERFTEVYVRSRMQRGFGPLRIREELRKKGVVGDLISAYLNAQSVDWVERARTQYHKRFGDQPANDYQERVKRARFLQGRGFSKEAIFKVLPSPDNS
ncbi:MAG: regulatory protein RecX [Gammaproteobacteria bacterium]|nr:regulatory protein RecX [Gammaproteobacteria bacterium]